MPPKPPQLFFSLTLHAQFSPMATISLILTTAVLVRTQSYALHVICGCSGQTDHLIDNINFVCHGCSREILPAAIASFKEVNIGNDSFYVESTFKYLGDTKWPVWWLFWCSLYKYYLLVESISRTVPDPRLLPILTNRAIQTKLGKNVFNMCVRKSFCMVVRPGQLWLKMFSDQLLLTVLWSDGFVVCPWKTPFQQQISYCTLVSVPLMTCCAGANWGSMDTCYIWMMMQGLKRLPCIMMMVNNQQVNHVRGFVMWYVWIWSRYIWRL